MITNFQGLPENGLPFLTKEHPSFGAYVADVSIRGFAHPPTIVPDATAVLVNETGIAVLALVLVWTYEGGSYRRHTISANFGSSMLLHALFGDPGALADRSQFIAPGSKRLITPDGIYGDNSDVLPMPAGVSGMGFGGSASSRDRSATAATCRLDFAILEDGRCAGPDESGMLETLRTELDEIRRLVEVMRAGGSRGVLFETLRPSLQRRRMPRNSPLLMVFGRMALDQVIEAEDDQLFDWLKPYSKEPALPLRRA